jgi:MFS family permease
MVINNDHNEVQDEMPSSISRWRNAITVSFGLGGIALSTWGPRLPALKADLQLDTGGLGVLLAGVTVGSVAGLLCAAPVITRFGARRAIPAVIVLVAATIALIGLGAALPSVPVVGVGFVVAGFCIGSLDVMINIDGAAAEEAAGRTLMPLMHAAWSGGAAVGSGIGAACAALDVSPSKQFLGEAVLIATAAAFVARNLPDGVRAGQEAPQGPASQRLRTWLRGWTDVRLLMIGVVMLGAELGEGSANNWLTLAAEDGHGLAPALAALFFTVFAVSEMLTRIAGGPLVDRFGRVATTRATIALGVVGVVLFILVDNPVVVLVGVLLWAVGVSMGFPLGMTAAAQSGPNPAARVSVVAAIGYFANLAGPPGVGFLAQSTGLLPALWLIAVLMLVAFGAAGSFAPRTGGSVHTSNR